MDTFLEESTVEILAHLYFGNCELVHHYEEVWSKNGKTRSEIEWMHIWMATERKTFSVNEIQFRFLFSNGIIEQTGGGEHEANYMLCDYYRTYLKTILTEKHKEEWEKRKNQKALK